MTQLTEIRLHEVVNNNGNGPLVDTGPGRPTIPARAFLNVSSLVGAGSNVDFTIVATVNGVDYVVATFANIVTGGGQETLTIPTCPQFLKVVYTTGGTITDLDATIDIIRPQE